MKILKPLLLVITFIVTLGFTPETHAFSDNRLECGEQCERQTKELKRFARNGNPYAQMLLGMSYRTGEIHGDVNPKLAWRWMKRAAEQSYSPAEFLLSEWHRENYNDEGEEVEALKYLERAVFREYPPALYQMGVNKLTDDELDEGIALLLQSADEGNNDAKRVLAKLTGKPYESKQNAKNGVVLAGPAMVTSTVEQTDDDVITVVGSLQEPMFLFESALIEIKEMNRYNKRGTTGSRLGDRKCGERGSACKVYKRFME